MQLENFQPEAARLLGVSAVTLSRWECDKIYPTSKHHQTIISYLGYNPFVNVPHPQLEYLQCNESNGVANLSLSERIGLSIKQRRLERKLTGKECAKSIGVSPRTLRDWEAGKHSPIGYLRERVNAFVGYDPFKI
jgi:transcriptional regulator with XRE-family HTH domain